MPKDDPRVQAYGDVDELNAAIGLATALEPMSYDRDRLEAIQRDLFTIGAELATPDPTKLKTPRIDETRIRSLEQGIDDHEKSLPPLKNFILPGGSPKAAAFHLARTTCRRAERAVVALAREQSLNPEIIKYLNRLSDLLFVLARAVNKFVGRGDTPW